MVGFTFGMFLAEYLEADSYNCYIPICELSFEDQWDFISKISLPISTHPQNLSSEYPRLLSHLGFLDLAFLIS